MLVKVFNTEHSCEEWCLLEFQGEILGNLTSDLGNIELKKDIAYMDLGQHTLEGNVIKLKTAFLVVEKEKHEGLESASSTGDEACLFMRGVVQSKIIFKQRPRPKRVSSSKN
jgi:hypothetical protein